MAEFQQLEPFDRNDYVVNDTGFLSYSPYQYYSWLYVSLDPLVIPIDHEHVPAGELALHRGARVEARDGHVGSVDEFVVDPRHGDITHLALWEGYLWGKKDVMIPMSEIDRIDDDDVYLKLDRHAVTGLPAISVHRRWW